MEEDIVEYPVRGKQQSSCNVSAWTLVGNLALGVRMLVALGLVVSTVVTVLIVTQVITNSPVLWASIAIQVIAIVMVLMDASSIKWMVEKLIKQLSAGLQSLRESLRESQQQIDRRDLQLEQTDAQLLQADAQLKKQAEQLTQMITVQGNMRNLLNSLMIAESEGANLNDLISKNLDKIERLLTTLSTSKFGDIDTNQDGIITPNEFTVYTSRSGHSRTLKPKLHPRH